MTDQEIENLYWATAQQYSAMANHGAVVVAFAKRYAALAAKPLTFPPIDTTAIPEKPSVIAAKRLKLEPFEYCERN
jgi:hypothetical protein